MRIRTDKQIEKAPAEGYILKSDSNSEYQHVISDGDKYFSFTQASPSSLWTIAHNLGKFPSVFAKDSADTVVYGDVNHVDINNLTITFSAPFSGTAECN